ncbi:hypothetical protein ACH5RR_027643 [Cinchona calisaya]|uniref:Uncharacterized protein n=1 Tax=Cinchona calisaya TaxID=153742 RepID=A0ABD2YLH7_9GENT
MASCRAARRKQRWCAQPLTPLMEGPDLEMQHQAISKKEKAESSSSSWEVIREYWSRVQRSVAGGSSSLSSMSSLYGRSGSNINNQCLAAKRQDLRLLLGVLACPLAPIPLPNSNSNNTNPIEYHHIPQIPIIIKDIPLEIRTAHYIIQQYLAATGCSSKKQPKILKNMYTAGMVRMICYQTEISSGKGGGGVKTLGTRSVEKGCFVLWQMSPGMWSLELVVGGNKVLAGSDAKIVWRHAPWLGTHAAKGPQRPLRRIIQGLDPKSTARLFAGKTRCLGEKRIGEEDCFVLKVAADREAVMERNEGPAEVIRHVLYGYFSQKSGLLIYLEDSHLTRVVVGNSSDHYSGGSSATTNSCIYWETTIGSSIGDYRDVDGLLIAHQGRTVATVFRFGENSTQHCRTTMEELWTIHDVVFDVPGLSLDSFIPPADIWDTC